MRKFKNLIAALLISIPMPLLAAPGAQGQVSSFTVNSGLIFELYNTAQQTNGVVTSWPSNMNAAFIQATVKNIGASDGPLCFQVVVQEVGSPCANANVVWSPIITTKDIIKAGEQRTLSALDFEIGSGQGGGDFCVDFEDQIKKDFENFNPSDLQKAVDMFLKRHFSICLVPVYCGADASIPAAPGSGNCSVFTLFQPNPGAQAQVAVQIYPHNNAVPDCSINFLWTPALYPGLGANDVIYTLELREDLDGPVFASADVPAGQTYYQWSARDRALTQGQKYYWRIISKKAKNGQPFGGPDGRGWNIQKWFTCGESQAKCRYTLEDLDRFIQTNASPDVREKLKGFKIKAIKSGQLDDPAICRLLNGKARVNSYNVTKQ